MFIVINYIDMFAAINCINSNEVRIYDWLSKTQREMSFAQINDESTGP